MKSEGARCAGPLQKGSRFSRGVKWRVFGFGGKLKRKGAENRNHIEKPRVDTNQHEFFNNTEANEVNEEETES